MEALSTHIDGAGALSKASGLVYCVGAQKAGTSWLYKQLKAHPDTYSIKKEYHYWDRRLAPYTAWDKMGFPEDDRRNEAESAMFLAGPDDHSVYWRYISENAPDGALVVDFTPSYALCSADTFREMSELHPNSKFIFVLRDPVQRLWSGIRHRFRRLDGEGTVQGDDLIRGFDRALNNLFDPDLLRSRYDLTISALSSVLPKSAFLVIPFEDMVSTGVDNVWQFLELDGRFVQKKPPEHIGVRSEVQLPAELENKAFEILEPAYSAAKNLWGELPDSWMQKRHVVNGTNGVIA